MRLGQELVARFDGQVPDTLDELVTLPGIGRKTANVVLGNAFDIPGITVDTHFGRLVRRWRWTELEDPVKVEFAIGELIERKEWTLLSHRVIFHGRRVCHAKKPACGVCVLAKDCPSFGTGPTDPLDGGAAGQGTRDASTCWRWPGSEPDDRMSRSTRWTVVVLVVVVALGVAFWRELGDRRPACRRTRAGQAAARDHRDADTAEALGGPAGRGRPRRRARAPARRRPRGAARHRRSSARATGRRSTSRARSPAAPSCSTCGRTGADRAPTNCPRWPSTRGGWAPR